MGTTTCTAWYSVNCSQTVLASVANEHDRRRSEPQSENSNWEWRRRRPCTTSTTASTLCVRRFSATPTIFPATRAWARRAKRRQHIKSGCARTGIAWRRGRSLIQPVGITRTRSMPQRTRSSNSATVLRGRPLCPKSKSFLVATYRNDYEGMHQQQFHV